VLVSTIEWSYYAHGTNTIIIKFCCVWLIHHCIFIYFALMFYIILPIWIKLGRRFPTELLRYWHYRENRHDESFPHLLFYLDGLGIWDLHKMQLSICGFHENRCREGRAFLKTINQIAFTRVPRNGMTYWKKGKL